MIYINEGNIFDCNYVVKAPLQSSFPLPLEFPWNIWVPLTSKNYQKDPQVFLSYGHFEELVSQKNIVT